MTLSGPSAGGGLPPSLLHAEPSSLSAAAMQDPEGLLPPESSPASPSAASTAPSSYAPSHHHHQHHPHQQLAPLAGPHAPRHPSPPGMPMPSSGPGPRGAHAAAAAAATPAKAVGAASRTGGGGAGAGVLRAAPPPPLPVPPPLHGPPGLLGTPGARAGQLPSLGVLPEPGEVSLLSFPFNRRVAPMPSPFLLPALRHAVALTADELVLLRLAVHSHTRSCACVVFACARAAERP